MFEPKNLTMFFSAGINQEALLPLLAGEELDFHLCDNILQVCCISSVCL
jgi:hypothetical protein